ncbi:MAG TPA: heat-inducible transcription repressor HrcA [Candidatus Latescibacteria bacterium]|nr:heat-inducible transcription repressor HrcA [Candidatus Latescibacterota bacterium]
MLEELSDRDRTILHSVIHIYVETAAPVASRTLCRRYRLGISSATVRHTMMELEDKGYVSRPHASAGRVPTDKGYRFYVDALMPRRSLSESEQEAFRQRVQDAVREEQVDRILEQVARALADMAKQLGVVLAPRFENGVLDRIELVPLTSQRLLLVLTIRSGLVKTVALRVDSLIRPEDVEETRQVLNQRLAGLTIREIRRSVGERMRGVGRGDPKIIQVIVDEAEELFWFSPFEDLYIGGIPYIFSQPEFRNPRRAKLLMGLLEEREVVSEVLSERVDLPGVYISIGREHRLRPMQSCSLLTATYQVGNLSGVVGILGPTRMRYWRLSALVQYAAQLVEELLQN